MTIVLAGRERFQLQLRFQVHLLRNNNVSINVKLFYGDPGPDGAERLIKTLAQVKAMAEASNCV